MRCRCHDIDAVGLVGDLRVQQTERKDGLRSWTTVWPEGMVHAEADRFLRLHDGSGTQRTYAYLLVDHLRWLERGCLGFAAVQLRDFERYTGIVGAEVRMPLSEPWRVGKHPCGRSALSTAAACLKGFHLHQSSLGVNGELGKKLGKSRLPSRVDLRRSFLGHVKLRIGELRGQVRGLEAEWTEETIQRITAENTALKQRVRRLTACCAFRRGVRGDRVGGRQLRGDGGVSGLPVPAQNSSRSSPLVSAMTGRNWAGRPSRRSGPAAAATAGAVSANQARNRSAASR